MAIRAADDPGLVAELADRGVVLDVCPISNLRTGVVASLAEHPLPELVAAGVACSVSTDDPAMFGTDLTADYAAAMHLGVSARDCYQAGLRGALCDQQTKNQLQQVGETLDWVRANHYLVGVAAGVNDTPTQPGVWVLVRVEHAWGLCLRSLAPGAALPGRMSGNAGMASWTMVACRRRAASVSTNEVWAARGATSIQQSI